MLKLTGNIVTETTSTPSSSSSDVHEENSPEESEFVFRETQQLLEDLRIHIPSSNTENNTRFSPLKFIISSLRGVRNTAGVSTTSAPSLVSLEETYQNLLPRINAIEKKLRVSVSEFSEKRLALMEQGRHLKLRLDACIIHNGDLIKTLDKAVEELRVCIGSMTEHCADVKTALFFNNELIRQKLAQQSSQAGKLASYMAWSFLVRQLTPTELAADSEYQSISSYLRTLTRYKRTVGTSLAAVLMQRETHSMNLEAAVLARSKVINMLKHCGGDRDTDKDKEYDRIEGNRDLTELDTLEGILETSYDHLHCHDCSCVPDMTSDCIDHFELLTAHTIEISKTLSAFIENKERICDLFQWIGSRASDFTCNSERYHHDNT